MKIISSKELLKNKLFTVTEEHAVDPDGFEIKRSIVRHPGSAVMMAVDGKNRILLVQQYRLPAKSAIWELPAGRLDPGETALKAAKRELKEETGFSAKKWTKLTHYFASPGYVDEEMTIFLAQNLETGEQQPMDDERIVCKWFEKKALLSAIREGEIIDAKTIIGFFTWLDMRKQAKKRK